MKKTVTINISGMIYTIDEDAFDKLNKYLNTIRGYFKDSDGRDEIMQDIEARIAEMLANYLSDRKQVVSLQDIELVISQMGQPEDYVDQDSSEFRQAASAPAQEPIASPRGPRRVYRDGEGNVLGGVCSGIGYYFGFDPIWLRIAFAVSFFVFGTGFLFYILLWIIIPKANTTSEKLEMKGEPVTIDNISKMVEEEMTGFKRKVDDFKEQDGKKFASRAKSGAKEVSHFAVSILHHILKFFGKIIGFLLLFIGTILLIALSAAIFGENTVTSITPDGINSFSLSSLLDSFFATGNMSWLFVIGVFILCGIPILSFILLGLRLLFGMRHIKKGFGFVFAALWTAGLVITIIVGISTANEFAKSGKDERNFSIDSLGSDTLRLTLQPDIFEDYEHRGDHDLEAFHLLKKTGDTLFYGYPRMDIQKSQTHQFMIKVRQTARGNQYKEAVDHAKNINYNYSLENNTASFNPYFNTIGQKWRNQEVQIIVFVPEGKSVWLSEDLDRIIYDVDNVTETLDSRMTGKVWTMTPEGLACSGCKAEEI